MGQRAQVAVEEQHEGASQGLFSGGSSWLCWLHGTAHMIKFHRATHIHSCVDYTYTHIHSCKLYTYIHIYTHRLIHTIHIHSYTHYTCIYTHTHTCTLTHTHNTHTHIHIIHIHTYTHTHTNTHSWHTYTHMHTIHTYTHTHILAHYTHIHTLYTYTFIHVIYIHMYIYTHTHTHMPTHTFMWMKVCITSAMWWGRGTRWPAGMTQPSLSLRGLQDCPPLSPLQMRMSGRGSHVPGSSLDWLLPPPPQFWRASLIF